MREHLNILWAGGGSWRQSKLKREVLYKKIIDNLEDCMELLFFFPKAFNWVLIFVGVNRKKQDTVKSLLVMEARPNIPKNSFLAQNWQAHVKNVKVLSMKTATRKVVPVQGLISLHICPGDVYTRVGCGIVENLAVGLLLGMLLIDRFICGMFPTKWDEVEISFNAVAILMYLLKIRSFLHEHQRVDVFAKSPWALRYFQCPRAPQDQ